jgi:hypothetical protein
MHFNNIHRKFCINQQTYTRFCITSKLHKISNNQQLCSLSAHFRGHVQSQNYKFINTNTQEHLDIILHKVHHLPITTWPCGVAAVALAHPSLLITLLEFQVKKERDKLTWEKDIILVCIALVK